MKNLNLKSMKYLTDIKNILNELKRSKKNEKTGQETMSGSNNIKEKNEIELLSIRIKELENEVQRYKKYIKKKNIIDEDNEILKIFKYKDEEIKYLKEQICNFEKREIEMRIEHEKSVQKFIKDIEEMQKCTSKLEFNHEAKIQMIEEMNKQKEMQYQNKIQELEDKNIKLLSSVQKDHQGKIVSFSDEIINMKLKFEKEIKFKEEMHSKQIEELNSQSQKQALFAEQRIKEKEEDFEKKCASMRDSIFEIREENLKYQKENSKLEEMIEQLRKQVEYQIVLENEINNQKFMQKKLKSKILDLQNNIQVFVRCKPKVEKNGKTLLIESMNDLNPKYVMNGNQIITDAEKKKSIFEFDKIFLPEDNQMDVFDEINGLIHGFIQGYNVCVFAYGQTGSGKTYTMLGDSIMEGIIPKSINYIFEELKGLQYEIEIKILEIYNESVKDLITEEIIKNAELEKKGIIIKSKDEIMKYIQESMKNKITKATQCNEFSSRSHSIYSLKLKIMKEKEFSESTINFIDLAGSERIKESLVEGARLKETQNINKSLLNLKIVFNSIINRDKHIPYRDSKLTYILKNSLLNKSKILMLLNVSIEDKDYQETLCSLRFGQVVGNVNVGRGVKQITRKID